MKRRAAPLTSDVRLRSTKNFHHPPLEEKLTSTADLKRERTITWDRYKGKDPDTALPQIYKDAQTLSTEKRTWYWNSIKNKRWTSLWARGIVFALLVGGTALPLLAGLSNDAPTRLTCTQIAISLLAIAGLVQIADRAFGWSSGWMRYITTVTAMESADSAFEIAWSKHLISKSAALDASDVQTLFALAEQFERDLIKLQTDETNGWITEFNAGISLLDSAIKAQREDTQKQLEAIRTAASSAQADAKADEKAKAEAAAAALKAKEPGVIDVALKFKTDTKNVSISLDGGVVLGDFFGSAWTSGKLPPGVHTVTVRFLGEKNLETSASAIVEPGKIAKLEIALPA